MTQARQPAPNDQLFSRSVLNEAKPVGKENEQVPSYVQIQTNSTGSESQEKTPQFSCQPSSTQSRELSFIDKKILKNERASNLWLTISKAALETDYQRAYELALSQSDDIYLLRLIIQTGPVISKGLTDTVAKKVLNRLNRINRGGVFYNV